MLNDWDTLSPPNATSEAQNIINILIEIVNVNIKKLELVDLDLLALADGKNQEVWESVGIIRAILGGLCRGVHSSSDPELIFQVNSFWSAEKFSGAFSGQADKEPSGGIPVTASLRDVNLAILTNFPDFSFRDLHLVGADLTYFTPGVDFSGSNLAGAIVSHPRAWTISEPVDPNRELVDLSGSQFVFANLSAALIVEANINGVDFSGADLTRAMFDQGCWGKKVRVNQQTIWMDGEVATEGKVDGFGRERLKFEWSRGMLRRL
ncbi:pentapeptide repeat-containing protein [Corynebacterium pollutisoli]|uniref:pentapeptide repeat-containing protein n=1 Tax=Corynebacterium pollutisoli TaxID=1610489 RepID=UPI001356329F|nr:pentapeptide repeat-containing protein [Corynebacterium pollutisoli]